MVMIAEQQGDLLDRISTGMCAVGLCGRAGQYMVEATYLVASLTLPVAITCGTSRVVTLTVPACGPCIGRK